MLMSAEKKFVFIEVPKTGTSAIAKRLTEIDPTLERDILYLPDGSKKKVSSTHVTAADIRKQLGTTANNYTFIGFIRNPIELLASKYFFYKIGRASKRVRNGHFSASLFVRHILARVLPMNIWIILYPYKSASYFIVDDRRAICLDIIGNFQYLEGHFCQIFSKFGYPTETLTLDKINASEYTHAPGKFFSVTAKISMWLHAPLDMQLYSLLNKDEVFFNKENL